MIPVDSITEQELDKRFDALSSKLKEALTSARGLSVVDQICEKNKITEEEKVLTIHQLVGLTILGFVHPYDLGSEINEALLLENPKLANAVAEELTAKVFAPIKTELENNYHPIISAVSVEKQIAPAKNSPVNVNKAPQAPKPSILSDVGWSKTVPAQLGSNPIPKPNTPPAPAPAQIPSTPAKPVITTPPPAAVPAPSSIPKPAAGPAPVMLHQDTTFKASQKNTGFTLSPAGSGANVNIGQASAIPTPPRPAVLEFGGVKAQQTNKPSGAPTPTGAVHYTDFKAPLSAAPTANTGPRNVSQITPSAPTPAAPTAPASMPPSPPKPPTPPQNNKPIVKDFL